MRKLSNCNHCKEYEKVVSVATASENGLTFELVNDSKHEIAKWKIDNCALKADDGSKCDYLLVVKKQPAVCYWVELKDEDFDDACLQIYSAITKIEETKN